jgi:hypothetical protein
MESPSCEAEILAVLDRDYMQQDEAGAAPERCSVDKWPAHAAAAEYHVSVSQRRWDAPPRRASREISPRSPRTMLVDNNQGQVQRGR